MRGSNLRQHAVLALLGLATVARSATWAGAATPRELRQVHIAVTSQLRGSITSRLVAPDMRPGGIAHLAPHVRRLRETWPELILVDAGNALTSAPDALRTADRELIPAIVRPMEFLRYDAAILGERDLGGALEIAAAVMGKTPFPWVGANVKSPNLPNLAEYAVVERSGLRIGFIGLVSPAAVLGHKPGRSGPLPVADVESAARSEDLRIRKSERADLVIAIGGGGVGGDFDRDTALLMGLPQLQAAGLLADEVPDLDLIIAGRGRTRREGEAARPNRSYKVPLIEPVGGSRALTVLTLEVVRSGNRWTITNVAQQTLWAEEKGDAQILAASHGELVAEKARLAVATDTYIERRPSKRAFYACAGALSHAAALRIRADTVGQASASQSANSTASEKQALPLLSLLPMMWTPPRWTQSDIRRTVIRRDVQRWIPQDDELVLATLTGRQIALLLVPYVRIMHGWKAPPSQVLFPGGLEIRLMPKSSEALELAFRESSVRLRDDNQYAVWMTEYHRFGGSGVAAKVLVQPDQPYHFASVSLRDAVMGLLSDAAQPLPEECQRFLRRGHAPPQHVSPRKRGRGRANFRVHPPQPPDISHRTGGPYARPEDRNRVTESTPRFKIGS